MCFDDAVVNLPRCYYRFHGVPRLFYSEYDNSFLERIYSQIHGNGAVKEAYIYFNNTASLPDKIKKFVTNGYNQKLSGDMQVIFKPQWFESLRAGTTHGLWNPYDSHIPLVWFGWSIKAGKTNRETYMTDIAPTVSALLRIQMPNASIGDVIAEVAK